MKGAHRSMFPPVRTTSQAASADTRMRSLTPTVLIVVPLAWSQGATFEADAVDEDPSTQFHPMCDNEKMLESLSELRTFLRIVDLGSLSAAARSLGLSVNSISRRLALLENRVGVRLANRTTRRLTLTDDGRAFAERCRRILAEVEETEEALQPVPGKLRGLVRVGLHPQLIEETTLRRFGALLLEHDRLSLHVLSRNSAVDPVKDGLDLVVWAGEVTLQSVVSRPLAIVDWVLAAAPDYVKRAGMPRQPADLATHECLRALRTRSETTWVLHNAEGRQVSVAVTGRFESDDTATLSAALYGGLGIGIRPRGEVQRESAAGRLVPILPRWNYLSLGVHLVSPPGRLRLPRVRAVAAIIESVVGLLG